MQLSIPNTFSNGTGPANIIDAPQVNANFAAVATVLNGKIEKDNVKSGAAICLNDTEMVIAAAWTFSSNPVFNAAAILDSYLTSNVPLKNGANTFAALQTFNAGTDHNLEQAKNFKVEYVAGLPAWNSSYKGRLLLDTNTNQNYVGGPSGFIRIDYVGGYTGGAISRYAEMGIVDDNDGFKLYFKTEGTPTVKIAIKGEPFPKRFYTELPYHTHVFSGNAHNHAITDGGHYHTTVLGLHGHGSVEFGLGTHTHGISGSTGDNSVNHVHGGNTLEGSQPNHSHPMVTTGAEETGSAGADAVTISGATEGVSANHTHGISLSSGGPSASQSVPDENLGTPDTDSKATGISINNATAGGTNGYAGVDIGLSLSATQKLYGKSLTVKIDATNITSNILTDTGWAAIGDGTGTHAFHTAGTGELDASGYMTFDPGLHILEILEPETGYGCSLLVHLETS